jgi:hypothetical protein
VYLKCSRSLGDNDPQDVVIWPKGQRSAPQDIPVSWIYIR